MVKEHTLHLFSVHYRDHADNDRYTNDVSWAVSEAHARLMFYTRFDDCTIMAVKQLLSGDEQ
jgi:hypothetical protein